MGSRNACGRFWTPFSWAGGVEERPVLAGRTLSVTPAACQLLRGLSPLKTSRTLTPPRECFRRKPARQLPLSVMTPPVKSQFWKIRRFYRIAK